MKKNRYSIAATLIGLMLAFAGCQPEDFELGQMLSVDALNFSVTQDAADPNMIILESLTPGVTPLWQTPMGRSTKVTDTLRIPFKGDYKIVYGVQSAGGYVESPDTFRLALTTDNLNYVNDPLWTLLSGGVGEEKTWVLDLDADGVSKFFVGPLYFYGTDDSWATVTDGVTLPEGSDSWNWQADWPGNQWIMPAGDYGTMTFDLKAGAHVTVDHQMLGRMETGTYFLDADAKTLSMTDASPLHDEGRDGQVVDWGDLKVLSLTENTLQLAALRDEALSGEGPVLLVYNYISKEYADNWVPEDLPDPEPPYDGNANEDLTTDVSTTKTWAININYPYNWHALDGTPLNEVATTADEGEFAFTTWVPPYDAAAFEAVTIELTKGGDSDGAYVITTATNEYDGDYTIDEDNNIDFGQPVEFFSGVGGWLTFGTTAENSLRILMTEKDALDRIEGLWLGQRAADKDEYLSIHLEPVSGAVEEDPLKAWKNALVGKTFVPDVNWFVDWVTSPPNFAGGWTSPETFGDDYETNSWIWTEDTRNVAEAASLSFFLEGDDIMCTKSQSGADDTTAMVVIDPEAATLTFGMELINYDGSPGSWLPRGGDGVTWHFVQHGNSNLNNVDTEGMWLGFENAKPGENDKPDGETTIFHYILKQD